MSQVTPASLRAFINDDTKTIITIYFDNDQLWHYYKDDEPLTVDMLETIGDIVYIKRKVKIPKKIGMKRIVNEDGTTTYTGGFSTKNTIESWIYKPLEDIQGIAVITDKDELPFIDTSYMRY